MSTHGHQISTAATTPPAQSSRKRWRTAVALVACLVAAPPAVATGLSFLGAGPWPLDLFTHFHAQYAFALFPPLLTLILLGRFALAACVALPLAANIALIAPFYSSAPAPRDVRTASADSALRVLQFNVHTNNSRHANVARYVNQCGADLVVLQEINAQWLADIQPLVSAYDISPSQPRPDNFGIALLVKKNMRADCQLLSTHLRYLGHPDIDVPAIEAAFRWNGQPLALLALHTLPPMRARYTHLRDLQLASAAQWAASQTGATIILGDLNTTPWAAPFRRLLRSADLQNSQLGFGLQPSWPAGSSPLRRLLRIPIDHCLHSRNITTVDRLLGPNWGSDHYPLLVTLAPAAPPDS